MFSISLGPEKLADLHTALNRALNTWEDAPAWLVELCDSIEKRNPTKLVEQITERLATLPTLDTSSFELRPYQRTAMAVGTEVHESVAPGPDQYLEDPLAEHLPEWAERKISIADGSTVYDGYATLRAQLCTRDGRKCGNAVVTRAFGGNYSVLTDMGTKMTLNIKELQELFHPPQYVMKPEAAGVRLKACVNEDEVLEMNAAKATLLRMNYEWRGGELWAPPLGAKGQGMAATALATELGDALIADGWRDPGPVFFGQHVSKWLRNLASEYLARDQQPAEKAVRGEAPGGDLPDWPEDLTTYEARAIYQRGVADGRIGWQRVETPTDPVDPSHRAMLTLRNLKFAIRWSAPNKDAMIEAVDAAIHFVQEAQKLVPTPPADPLDTPLPCDITVGHGTHKKGVKLRSLVTRMQGLYDNSVEHAAVASVINEMAEQVYGGQLFVSTLSSLSMTRDQFYAYIENLKREHRVRAEAVFAKR